MAARRGWRSGSGTARACHGRRARRRGWWGSRRRRRRTRGRRSRTGANSHGTVHDASTASATVARGAPGLPNTTRRPELRSTAVTRSRPSNRRLGRARPGRAAWLSVSGGRGRPRSSSARTSAPPGAATPSASGANVALAASAVWPARRSGRDGGHGQPAGRSGVPDLELGADRRRTARRVARDQMRGDDRPRGGADERLALAQVDAGRVLDARPARPSSTPRRARRRHRARAHRAGSACVQATQAPAPVTATAGGQSCCT